MFMNRRQAIGTMSGAAVAASGLAAPAIANTSLVVGALRLTSHSASFVALQRGYFESAGLNVELRFFDAAQPMAVAIASGDVDYGITAMTGALISLADRGAVKIIGGALQEEAGVTGQKYLVSDAAFQDGVTTPAALDGRRYAVSQAGSSFHYMGSKMAQAEGIELEFVPLQSVGNIISSLRSGQVDGWSIVPHIALALSGSGAVHIVGDVADYIPNYQVTTVFTSQENAANERAMTQGFLSAFSQGVADFNATMVDGENGDDARDEMVRLIHQYVYTDREYDAAAPTIINGSMRLSPNAALNVASLQDQLNWFKAEDLVDADIAFETVVDSSYVDTV